MAALGLYTYSKFRRPSALASAFQPRAATEGRPYSSFDNILNRLGFGFLVEGCKAVDARGEALGDAGVDEGPIAEAGFR